MTSPFGAAFDKLDRGVQRAIAKNLVVRKNRYLQAMGGQAVKAKAILFGDTPGPGRPTDPNYHHTPFYSTKNSSLWVNRQLAELQVPEEALLWFNTTLADGTKLDAAIVQRCLHGSPTLFALGGNAATWLDGAGLGYTKVHHPQAWKRFHSKDPYPLLGYLRQALDL